MKILVVGAGIGGLTAARFLTSAGHRVTLVERAPSVRAVGAGLILPNRTASILEDAGVRLSHIGMDLTSMDITSPRGEVRASVRDRVTFPRPEMMKALASNLEHQLDVRWGVAADSVTPHGEGVVSALDGREEQFDFVVAADGLRSKLRATECPDVELRNGQQVCWRGIIDGNAGHRATEMWNGSERIGVVPLAGDRTYVYVVEPTSSAHLPRLRGTMTDRERWAVAALQHLPSEQILRHEIWELERPTWGRGRLAFVGDAAHGMTPNLGLGAAMAISDSAALTRSLTRSDRVIDLYRRSRGIRVRSIQLASRYLGRVAHSGSARSRTFRKLAGLAS